MTEIGAAPRVQRAAAALAARRPLEAHVLAVAGVTLAAAALRFPTLAVQSFWGDEANTIDVLRHGFGGIVDASRSEEVTPPFYYLVAWVWTAVFGMGEVGLRSLSALLGTATVPVAYGIGSTLGSRRTGVILAALAAVSPFLVWYSQEARSYPLLLFLGAVSFLAFARALREPSGRVFAVWAVSSALALATHYFALFLVGVEALWLLVAYRRQRVAAFAVAGAAVVGAALLPVAVPHARVMFRVTTGHDESALGAHLVDVPKKFVLGPSSVTPIGHAVWVGLLLVLIGVVLAATRADRAEQRGAAIAAIVAGAAAFVPVAVALTGFDVVNPRNLIALWLPATLVPAVGFGARRAAVVGTLAAVALCALLAATTVKQAADSSAYRDDWRTFTKRVEQGTRPQAIVVSPWWVKNVLEVYAPDLPRLPAGGRRVREIDVVVGPDGDYSPPRRPGGVADVRKVVVGRLVLVRYRLAAPRRVSADSLEAMFPRGDVAVLTR